MTSAPPPPNSVRRPKPIASYRRRVAGLASPLLGTEHDDLVSAIYEAERSLGTAERVLQRAIKVARN